MLCVPTNTSWANLAQLSELGLPAISKKIAPGILQNRKNFHGANNETIQETLNDNETIQETWNENETIQETWKENETIQKI